MMIKLSKTSKMPCPSWSIPAGGKYCPGSAGAEVCEGCYAQKGFYHMPVVKNSREHNATDWKRPAWVGQMVLKIKHEPYFRWFDSGDLYHPKLAEKIIDVCATTPTTKHWIPTKMWTVLGMVDLLTELGEYDNVAVRESSKDIDVTHTTGGVNSVVMSKAPFYHRDVYVDVHRCPAPLQDHKCNDCRACWDKTIQTVGYLLS